MVIVLFDNKFRKNLQPLTSTKAVALLRLGIFTFQERAALVTRKDIFVHTEEYLQGLYQPIKEGDNIWIDASVILTEDLWNKIAALELNTALVDETGLVAGRSLNSSSTFNAANTLDWFANNTLPVTNVKRLQFPHEIFLWNDALLRSDFELVTKGKTSEPISHTNQVIQHSNIFIEKGAVVEFATLNSTAGPIYIGKRAVVQEGSFIRGPFSLGENAMLKMGSKIYGATTIGPNCVCGGEIKNVVIHGNTNKGHEGYLGDSVIGEWCNLGAGTSNSNVKNTGGNVDLWNEGQNAFINAGQKCGVIMGDYTRVAINSSINTGAVFGISCNVFGNGLLPKKLGNFVWGTADKYIFEKALHDIQNWKTMKHQLLSTAEVAMLKHIFENN